MKRGTLITPMCYRPIVRGASRQYGVKDVLGSIHSRPVNSMIKN
ncbi:hypothetical protein CLOLEP_03575 [[Clostridium] leptum DSM 753]|uniref:Uncharacterized protein n=1 Tax=[Clostridium] leptum DSM 753 TaxID=428125 RepID=A7VY97_9FIRM|nr:hypothetical protein CLOLEP_03575 [[Clostridium] leptum DSM 753]